ncbi:TPA: hypothetical protein ACQJWO_006001, partial [Klebsiella pneumoniae]
MTRRPLDPLCRLRVGVASPLMVSATGSYALSTASIASSVVSPDCLEYRIGGFQLILPERKKGLSALFYHSEDFMCC